MKVSVILLILLLLFSCKQENKSSPTPPPVTNEPTKTRTFKMGFTPWPYAATLDAVNETYSFIENNSDLIAHHIDSGVPWSESITADNFSNFGQNIKDEINGRVLRLNNKQTVYLGVSPFSGARDGIALYWNTSANQPLPSPWDTLDIGNDFVVASYANYVHELIKQFDPTHINFGIEINEFYHNVPADRDKLDYFVVNVYSFLKNIYPNKTFMVSFVLGSPGSTKMQETADLFIRIKYYVDMIGISVYPYAFFDHADKGDPANLPSNWLSQIKDIAPDELYFIAETGFLGESLSIPAFGLNVIVDEDKQQLYVEKLFEESNKLNAQGIVWFAPYDFDDLWNSSLGDDLSLIWRDTGLKDGNQTPRKALDTWTLWKSYSKN